MLMSHNITPDLIGDELSQILEAALIPDFQKSLIETKLI